jgi:putative aldouronate transport system permease protein
MMFLPVVVFYILFHYVPMAGAVIAFKDFSPGLGILGSPWAGIDYFKMFFAGPYFQRIIGNTIILSALQILFAFPSAIILALLLNELRSVGFKRVVQTITYLPYFISLVVICGIIVEFCSRTGIITRVLSVFGFEPTSMLLNPNLFRPIYIVSDIWQFTGWNSIIYLAALTGIDQELYDAAKVDGAGRFKQLLHVTLPGLIPTIMILLILRIGQLLNIGFEKVILLYNPGIYETADVISSFVYRKGILEMNFSYAGAVGLFNSVINFGLLVLANKMSQHATETSLW